jgi:hypothetical protein
MSSIIKFGLERLCSAISEVDINLRSTFSDRLTDELCPKFSWMPGNRLIRQTDSDIDCCVTFFTRIILSRLVVTVDEVLLSCCLVHSMDPVGLKLDLMLYSVQCQNSPRKCVCCVVHSVSTVSAILQQAKL